MKLSSGTELSAVVRTPAFTSKAETSTHSRTSINRLRESIYHNTLLIDWAVFFRNSSAVRFSMKYNVMPWVGPLLYGVAGEQQIRDFPSLESRV
jgi:hypothetical protein